MSTRTATPAERLRWARERAGYDSAAAFARDAEVPEVTYRAHERGPGAVGGRGLSEKAARLYAHHLGVSWAWLLTGSGDPLGGQAATEAEAGPRGARGASPELLEVPAAAGMIRDVPVRGVAVGGNGGCFELNGEVVDYVRRPPGIHNARNVFAIYVVGSSMAPRFDEGDLVFVHPDRPPVGGCDVLVELHGGDGSPGECFIKRLVKRNGRLLILEQFNPPRADIEIPLEQVRALYRILTPAELLGL